MYAVLFSCDPEVVLSNCYMVNNIESSINLNKVIHLSSNRYDAGADGEHRWLAGFPRARLPAEENPHWSFICTQGLGCHDGTTLPWEDEDDKEGGEEENSSSDAKGSEHQQTTSPPNGSARTCWKRDTRRLVPLTVLNLILSSQQNIWRWKIYTFEGLHVPIYWISCY